MALDTLEILIEADASGLNTQLKKAGNSIQSFVSQMNKQEVNWQSILAGTISPAIIAGIASTFALALASSMEFTNSLTTSANSSSTAFQSNMGNAGQSALALQASTGQSASSIIQAMASATQALGSYAAGNAEVTTASQIALATGMNLKELVSSFTPVLSEWGVKADDVSSTVKQLFGTAMQGKVAIGELDSEMALTGPSFKNAGVSINEASAALEALSMQANMTVPAAKETFEIIAKATDDIHTRVLLSTIGVKDFYSTLKTSGVGGVMAEIEKYFASVDNTTAHILGNKAGFSDATIDSLRLAAGESAKLVTNTAQISANAQTLATNTINNLGPTQKLQQAWGAVKSDLVEIIGLPVENFITKLLTSFDEGVKGLQEELKRLSLPSLKDLEGSVSAFAGGVASSISTDASKFTSNLKSGVSSLFGGGAQQNVSQTPAGSSVVHNTTNNVVNNNISSSAIGNGKGVNSQNPATTAYQGSYGY